MLNKLNATKSCKSYSIVSLVSVYRLERIYKLTWYCIRLHKTFNEVDKLNNLKCKLFSGLAMLYLCCLPAWRSRVHFGINCKKLQDEYSPLQYYKLIIYSFSFRDFGSDNQSYVVSIICGSSTRSSPRVRKIYWFTTSEIILCSNPSCLRNILW